MYANTSIGGTGAMTFALQNNEIDVAVQVFTLSPAILGLTPRAEHLQMH
jgi:S-formylglutathione hydrolase FrmB